MLDWQVKWIHEHLLKLCENTQCDTKLLDQLNQRMLLTKDEINDLERIAIHDDHGGYKKVKQFYSLLTTRDAYDHLIQVLEQNFQTDAAQILNDGWEALDRESMKNNIRLKKYISLPKGLEEFLKIYQLNSGKICVVSTLDCDVTCERIKDAGGIPIMKWEREGFDWEIPKHTTIVFNHVDDVKQMISHEISDVMRNSSRIIIITKKNKEKISREVPNSFPITVAVDKLTLENLSEGYKEDLLNRKVLIQGRLLPLQEWIHSTGVPLNDNEVGGQLLIDLINNQTPVLLKDTLPQKLHYYVSRRLRSRTLLNRDKIFQDRSKDVFVFTGLQRYQLSTLVSEGHTEFRKNNPNLDKTTPATDSSKIQIKTNSLSVRFILLDYFSDFEDICDRTSEPVHWVQCEENGTYRLLKSRGSIQVIRGIVKDENKQNECSEEEFLNLISSEDLGDLSEQHECISDSPGMGKSVLLAEVGRQSLERDATTVGIFQELTKLIKSIKKNFHNQDLRCADKIIQHLFASITTCDFSKSCLESGFKSEALKINLFLDAYDEVDSKDVDVCKTILKLLKDCENIRVFITSRPHLLPELENIFEVLGWNILPFTQQDQYNFLVSYWKNRPEGRKYNNMKIDLPKLEKYTNKFVSTLQKQWNDKDRAIAGIPLQCQLICNIFHAEAFKSCSQGSSPNSSEPLPEIESLTNLYMRTVEKKLEIFKEKYPTTSLDYRKVNNWYAAQAFCDLFPDVDYEVFLGEDDADPEEMIRIGIVERKGAEGKIEFIHRTFAEYFIAKALFQLLTNPQDTNSSHKFKSSLVSFLKVIFALVEIRNLLYMKFQWLEIVYHLNALLEDANTVCAIPLNLNFSEQDLRKLTNSIVWRDLPNILKLLQNWNSFKGIENKIFTQELIKTAVEESCLKLIQIVVQYKTENEISEMNNTNGLTLLHFTVRRGDYNIFEFILETYFKDKIIKGSSIVFRCLVQNCIEYSSRNSDVVISGKKEIINRLLELNNKSLELSYVDTIKFFDTHPQLFFFITERKYVFASESSKKKLLDQATFYMSWEYYFNLVQKLCENGHLQKPISNSETVEIASSKYSLSNDTFIILKKAEVNFKNMSKLVFRHASGLTNDESVEYLKSFFDVWVEEGKEFNPDGESYLHVALNSFNPTIVAWLINTKGLNVNCVDTTNGDTPLQYICRIKCDFLTTEQVTKIVEMINVLINKGGDPRILNSKRESLLHLAAEKCCEEIVKVLIDTVEDINGKDCNGNTALLRAVKNEDYNSILNTLLEHGANPKVSNDRGENLLHFLYFDELWVERLVEGLSVDSTDKKGNTPIHFAALKSDCLEVISKLVEKGGNVNAVNKSGFTPFDVYLYQAQRHSLEVVKYFIAHVPNIDQMRAALKTFIYRKFGISLLSYEKISSKINYSTSLHLKATTKEMIINELLSNGADMQVLKGDIDHIFRELETVTFERQREFLELLLDHRVCSIKEIAYQGLVLMVKCDGISEVDIKFRNSFADHLDDINKRDSEGRTLLHLACQAESLVDVQFLIEKGAKVNELDGKGKTPLDVFDPIYRKLWESEDAYLKRKQLIVEFLKSNGAESCFSSDENLNPGS